MEKNKIKKALDDLLNIPVWYNNQLCQIKKYELDDERERVFIHFTDRGPVDRPYESALTLIESFEPVPQNKPGNSAEVMVHNSKSFTLPFLDNSQNLEKASEIALQQIEDISSGKISIDRANAIHNSISMLVEIEKTKVQKAVIAAKFLGK